jgi:hypothetical protein
MRENLINTERLRELLSSLGESENVIACMNALPQLSPNILLESPGAREELLRIYARRERTSKRAGYVVPGGAQLVEGLTNSKAERVFVVPIDTLTWYGIIFLEDSESMQCLGCVGSRDASNSKRV